MAGSVATTVQPGRGFWLCWVLANALSEIAGLAASAVVWFLLTMSRGSEMEPTGFALLLTVLLLGALGGTLVGYAQWLVLRRAVAGLAGSPWILATVGGALTTWLLGMLAGGKAGAPPEESPGLIITGAALVGAGLGALLGVAQWFVLRRHVRRAGWWVLANALAWAGGMAVAFFGADAVRTGETLAGYALRDAATGLAAGVLVGGIHGAFLVGLLRRQRVS